MNNITEIQSIWDKHKFDNLSNIKYENYANSIRDKIELTEKKVLRLNIVKTIAIILIMTSFLMFFDETQLQSITNIIGLLIILIGTIITMVVYWKIQFKSKSLDYSLPQNEFINIAVHKINAQKEQFKLIFTFFIIILILGLNILYIDLISGEELITRVFYHLGMSVFLFSIFMIGLRIRRLKFKKEFQPLIDELIELKRNNRYE